MLSTLKSKVVSKFTASSPFTTIAFANPDHGDILPDLDGRVLAIVDFRTAARNNVVGVAQAVSIHPMNVEVLSP